MGKMCIRDSLLRDENTGLELLLKYGVFEKEDVITRAAVLKNSTEGMVSLEKMLSVCLDMPFGEWEMIHFHGRHAMERQVERTPLCHGTVSIGSKRGTSSHHHNPSLILCTPQTTEDAGDCYGTVSYTHLYGGRDELRRAFGRLAAKAVQGQLDPDSITEDDISNALDTAGIPDPDLLIRTCSEQRLSNFLLWQLAYTEFYISPVPWPDFTKEELVKAVEAYNHRDRRYGLVKDE